jgi:hypothetical protein
MSLKQKAKTLNELLWENRLEWDKWLRMGVTEQKQVELAPKYQEKWVRLEDAEEALLDRLIPFEQEVSILQKERLELKQKLRQFAKFLDDFYKRRRSQIVRPKFYEIFGELLKDGNE